MKLAAAFARIDELKTEIKELRNRGNENEKSNVQSAYGRINSGADS